MVVGGGVQVGLDSLEFGPYLCVFHFIWILDAGGGGLPRDWYTTCLCIFSAYTTQKSKIPKLIFLKLIFLIL